ncbi:MAG TPA: orotidine-5'-phosphate decarboxylase, partial [Dongiaceae bacterium]
DAVSGVKIGLEFFNAHGPAGVAEIAELGAPLFLDLKFHDIPNTVAGAVRAVAPLKPMILNLHAAGGDAMMRAALDAARDSAARLGATPPKLIAVTVLTSLSDVDLAEVGQPGASDQVRRLAALTRACGLDGVVCSPHEVAALRRDLGRDFLLVVPGVRPAWAAAGDQKRIMEPRQAMAAGADFLVIGRPITAAADPAAAARRIVAELSGVAA